MDQPRNSPEPRERAVSSEPCSTRPNPFDDDELSARKRRRTSLSGGASPSRSSGLGSAPPSQERQPPTHSTSLSDDVNMKVDTEPVRPRTPDRNINEQDGSAEPMSSRVTINLRNSQRPPDHPTDPASSPLSSKGPVPSAFTKPTDDVKISVEESEIDMFQADGSTSTPTSSALDASSPPVEVIDTQEEDDDAGMAMGEANVMLMHDQEDGEPPEDPAPQIPFRQDGEHLTESLHRIGNYILTHDKVASSLEAYLESYSDFARRVPYEVIHESIMTFRAIWIGLSDIISNVHFRRHSIKDREIRSTLPSLFSVFASLTGQFVVCDLVTLSRITKLEDASGLELISPSYINVLAQLCSRDDSPPAGQYQVQDDIYTVLSSFMNQLSEFQPAGALGSMLKLAHEHVELLDKYPRLSDNLHHICQLSAIILTHQSRLEKKSGRFHVAYELYKLVSEALSTTIDKAITNLSHEHTGYTIKYLGDVLKMSLQHPEHPGAVKVVEDFRKSHPDIVASYIPEVISSQYRFIQYSRLIMSSQMQLRVMAVAQMCSDMVACWNRFHEPQDSNAYAVQLFFANFLLASDLVPYILGPTCHPEITSESYNIIGFLLATSTYTNKHSDLLWQTVTTTQDPRVSDALLRMVGRIGRLFSYDGLMYLCSKLELLPVEGFTPMIRYFADSIISHALDKRSSDRLELRPYMLFLRLMRESSVLGPKTPVAHPDIFEFASAKFKFLLTKGPESNGREVLYENCIQDIANKSPTTMGSLAAISFMMTPMWTREMIQLNIKHSFATLLVDELEHAIKVGRQTGHIPVISGHCNTPRRDLLAYILLHQAQAFASKELGRRLWGLMVGSEAACQEDRDDSWKILNECMDRARLQNPFLATCLSEYIQSLSPECFSSGTLALIRPGILEAMDDPGTDILEDRDSPVWGAIEQIWRMILTTTDTTLEKQAIKTLVSDIYLHSRSIQELSPYRVREVHLAFVDRCLTQLFSAADILRTASEGTSGDDSDTMVVVASEARIQEQSLQFVRSLAVLREFHQLYAKTPKFSTPDLRSLPLPQPSGVEGDSAELKFQSFDGEKQTEVKDLNIGRRNTAGSLLASLKEATGFENYRLYYRGQALLPHETDICKSLEDLRIHNGLILVKRDESVVPVPSRIRPGASPVEIAILTHFDKLWECLSMDDAQASKVYQFLTLLPADQQILGAIADPAKSPTEIFPVGQSYKSMYAVHAMVDLLRLWRRKMEFTPGQEERESMAQAYTKICGRVLSLAVLAIRSPELIEACPKEDLRIHMVQMIVTIIATIISGRSYASRYSCGVSTALEAPEVLECLDSELLSRLTSLLEASATGQVSDEATKLTFDLLQVILDCGMSKMECWDALKSSPEVLEVIEQLILHDYRPKVRLRMRDLICRQFKMRESLLSVPTAEVERLFWGLACRLVTAGRRIPQQNEESFCIWVEMFKVLRESRTLVVDKQELFKFVSHMLMSYETTEELTSTAIDVVPQSLAQMLILVLTQVDETRSHGLEIPTTFSSELFWKHMFPRWTVNNDPTMPRPVLTSTTRSLLISAMLQCIGTDKDQVKTLIENLATLVPCDFEGDDEPYHSDIPVSFDRNKAIRAPCGYAGMKNLSNTCYLNSLFTQLYMNVGFRKFMLSVEVKDGEFSQKLLLNTQNLFGHLQNSFRRYIDPLPCVVSIRTYEDSQIDVHNQMDVDEFFNLLWERWESQLLSAESKNKFRSFYGGQLVQQVKSQECEHISERLEPFSAIQCDIKGKSSLQESLQAYVDGEIMGGDNKYKCSTCDRHVDAVKRACLKDIQDDLIFHLKRFDFNLRTLTRNKINDYFSFPPRIDMRPYTIDHLSDSSKDSTPDWFDLVGVLVHQGTAESGHYYSYIRERPTSRESDSWFEFNDDTVTPWNPQHLESACFGGLDYRGPYDSNNQPFDKPYSAYMLFYQRSSIMNSEQQALEQNRQLSPVRVDMENELMMHIHNENKSILRRHCLFDPAHIKLVVGAMVALQKTLRGEDGPGGDTEEVAIGMVLGHLDQVFSRAKDTPDFEKLLTLITGWTRDSAESSSLILRYFSDRRIPFRMILQKNLDPSVRASFGDFMLMVIGREGARWEESLQNGGKLAHPWHSTSYLQQSMVLIQELWNLFHGTIRSWHDVFGFMLGFVQLGRKEMAAFLDNDGLSRLVMVIAADVNDPAPQFARMALMVSRRMGNRPPNYSRVIALLAVLLSSVVHRPQPTHVPLEAARTPRLWVACHMHQSVAFDVATDELNTICQDWDRVGPNIFVEKLLVLNQNPEGTDSVIAALVRLSMVTQEKVFITLQSAISGNIVNHQNQPFLRAATVFCRTSMHSRMMNELFLHICEQCRLLQNNEGRAFFEFQRDVFPTLHLGMPRERPSFPKDGLVNLYRWVPALLCFAELSVGAEVVDFLQQELFNHGPSAQFAEEDGGEARTEATDTAAQLLAMECLRFLRDNFVVRDLQIQHQVVLLFQKVLGDCEKFFEGDNNSGVYGEYQSLRRDVMRSVQDLMVEDLEDDGSEWDNSVGSSEQLESVGDFNMHTAGDAGDDMR